MRRPSPAWLLTLFVVLLCQLAVAQGPAKSYRFTPEQVKQLTKRKQLAEQANQLFRTNQLREGIPVMEQVLQIERDVFGTLPNTQTLEVLANLHQALDNLDQAKTLWEEVVENISDRRGKDHWEVVTAKLNLGTVEMLEGMTPQQRQRLNLSTMYNGQAIGLYQAQRVTEALAAAQQALKLRRELAGNEHL